MTGSGYTGGSSPDDLSGGSTEGAKAQAQQAAGTAAEEGKHVAGVAAEEATNVAGEARAQVQNLMQQAGEEVDAQSRQQKDRLAGTMRTFSEDLDAMASQGGGGMAAQVAREVADRARSLSTHLERREPRDLLDDVRDFARRKPGTFLLGALAAGVVAGRLARGAKEAPSATNPPTGGGASTPELGYPTAPSTPGVPPGPGPGAALDPLGGPTVGAGDPTPGDERFDPSEPGGRL